MRLIESSSWSRRDFTGLFRCEHCGHEQTVKSCYDDEYYHASVIPAMKCGACGKSSNDPSSCPRQPDSVVM